MNELFDSLLFSGDMSYAALLWFLFLRGGWALLFIAVALGFKEWWIRYIRDQYEKKRKFVMLAINIPKANEQSPKAVEQIFAQIHGAAGKGNLLEQYWQGRTTERFSFEIVSTGGFIQFYVRTPAKFRDLVEAAFYSQYPDADIVESQDYTEGFPGRFPDPEWNLFGTELKLAKEEAYPLRTYVQFEHTLSQELKDPISGMLESMSKLGSDEHLWIQYVASPVGNDWKEGGARIAKFLSGGPVEREEYWFLKLLEYPVKVIDFIIELLKLSAGGESEAGGKVAKAPDYVPSLMIYLTPGERTVLEGVQMKMTKQGFRVKIRFIYIAKHAAFKVPRAMHPILGAFRQFNTLDMNALVPVSSIMTDINYFFKRWRLAYRQRRIMHHYRERDDERGAGNGKILNIEELASLYHFPVITVKAPLIHKTEAKQAEPPFALPVADYYAGTAPESSKELKPKAGEGLEINEGQAPERLPLA